MKTKPILILLVAHLGFSCEKSPASLECDESPTQFEYVPGEVLVGLVDTVTYQFVVDFFQSLNLQIIDFDLGHNFWAKADSNDLGYYQDLFSSDTTIEYINKLPSSPIDTLLVTITFNGVNSLALDSVRVESFGLHIYKSSRHPKFAQIGVSIGQELCWAKELDQYAFVRYAEPNYYADIGFAD